MYNRLESTVVDKAAVSGIMLKTNEGVVGTADFIVGLREFGGFPKLKDDQVRVWPSYYRCMCVHVP